MKINLNLLTIENNKREIKLYKSQHAFYTALTLIAFWYDDKLEGRKEQ